VAASLADALGPCIASGALSKLQVEGALHAAAKHEAMLPEGGPRCGFVLGDGAGVGKGRQLAAIALAHQVRVLAARAEAGSSSPRHHPRPRPARSIWVSTSRDLLVDARRDFDALTGGRGGGGGGGGGVFGAAVAGPSTSRGRPAPTVTLFNGPDEALAAGPAKDGVLFLTYTTLARKGNARRGTPSRLEQVVQWAAAASSTGRAADFDGCLIWDESHKAKAWPASAGDGRGGGGGVWIDSDEEDGGGGGRRPPKSNKPSATALAVVRAQELLPKARVVYGEPSRGGPILLVCPPSLPCPPTSLNSHLSPSPPSPSLSLHLTASATGVSEVHQLRYMCRLGLWGPGCAFRSFDAFHAAVSAHGVSFLEMLACELKASGLYMTRALSYRAAEFDMLACPMDEDMVAMYDRAASLWARARVFASASGGRVMGTFFGAQSRFYRSLTCSLKVPAIVRAGMEALARGDCVVIGLQSTGETLMAGAGVAPGDRVRGLLSAAREALLGWLLKHVPPHARGEGYDGEGGQRSGRRRRRQA